MSNLCIYEDQYFRLEQVQSCPIPGYLILYCQDAAESVAALPVEITTKLGPCFQAICAGIQALVQPDRIYTAAFGEILRTVHWHFFPRMTWMLTDFFHHHPQLAEQPLNGSLLLDWGRHYYAEDSKRINSPLQLADAVERLSRRFSGGLAL